MIARKLIANLGAFGLSAGFVWALGCASIIGADDYKVVSGTSTGTGAGPATTTGNPSTTTGMCLANTTECTATPGNCCSGVCFQNPRDAMDTRFCAATCNVGADCNSGCCTMMTDRKSCAPKGFCPDTCVTLLDPCNHPAECCQGSTCITDGTDTACVPTCTIDAECAQYQLDCCVKVNGVVPKVCLPTDLCPTPP